MPAVAKTTSSNKGTLPPHKPVLPPCMPFRGFRVSGALRGLGCQLTLSDCQTDVETYIVQVKPTVLWHQQSVIGLLAEQVQAAAGCSAAGSAKPAL